MRLGNKSTGILALILWLGLSSFMSFMPMIMGGAPPEPGASEFTIPQRFMVVGMDFVALPQWVTIWMGWQHFVFASALLFVIWEKEAQLYVIGLIASHAIMFGTVAFGPMSTDWLKLAALTHWLWIPAYIMLLRNWSSLPKNSGYWAWASLAIAQMTFSFAFDIPDGILFLIGLVT